MSTKASIILAALSIGQFFKEQAVSIPSYMQPTTGPSHGAFTLSKRTMQRMKGKAARKNRGKNRGRYVQ